MKNIAIVGAGGFGREVACLIDLNNRMSGGIWKFIGFFDDGIPKGESGVIGTVEELNQWGEQLDVVIAIGNPTAVRTIANKLTNPHLSFPNIIAPDITYLDERRLTMGKGNIISFQSIISCDVSIGDFNIFNGKGTIGHDAVIGSYNVVMPSVSISGSTQIGDGNFFGVGSILLQGIKVGTKVRLAAGSVLTRKTKDGNLYIGNPASLMKL